MNAVVDCMVLIVSIDGRLFIRFSGRHITMPLIRSLLCCLTLVAILPFSRADVENTYIFNTIVGNSPLSGVLQRFAWPLSMAIDASGIIYVADTDASVVYKVTPAGGVSIVAGKSTVYETIDGPAETARFKALLAVAIDESGNVFVGDNRTIRKITPSGEVSTFAGVAGEVGVHDGPLAEARFGEITCLSFDGSGNLYTAAGQDFTIRKITPAGIVATLAGAHGESGSVDGIGSAARFGSVSGMVAADDGTLYIADGSNRTIRKVSPAGEVTTLAGRAGQSGSADGLGSAARFGRPRGITLDSMGNLFVSDAGNHTIRKITAAGLVSTLAGKSGLAGGLDGTGEEARFIEVSALVSDATNNIYGTDSVDGTLRKITPAGVVTTLVGVGRDNAIDSIDGPDSAAQLAPLTSIAIASNNDVYIADYFHRVIRKVPAGGKIFIYAGGMDIRGHIDGPALEARFSNPVGVAVDDDGVVYVADSGNNQIRKISTDGIVSTLDNLSGQYNILDGIGGAPAFHNPVSVAVDHDGTLYVCDAGNYFIRKISPTGVVSLFAGKPHQFGEVDGLGSEARFYHPAHIVLDGLGNAYVLDRRVEGRVVRKITAAGLVSTIDAGDRVTSLTVDQEGNVYVLGATITKISPRGTSSPIVSKAISNAASGRELKVIEFTMTGDIAVDKSGDLLVTSGRSLHKGQAAVAPKITEQPHSLSVKSGEQVRFSVAAEALPEATYQWFYNGSPFQDATTSELAFTNARATDAGNYTVVVTNEFGSATSEVAKLSITSTTVSPPPSTGSSGSSGGGGGAPSVWFLFTLTSLAVARRIITAACTGKRRLD